MLDFFRLVFSDELAEGARVQQPHATTAAASTTEISEALLEADAPAFDGATLTAGAAEEGGAGQNPGGVLL